MSNDAVHLLVGAYAVDALAPEERAAFAAHLARCADCRVEVPGLRAAAAHLGGLVAVVPPEKLRVQVLGEASTARRRFRPAVLAAAAAVIAVVGAGALVAQELDPPAPVGVAAQVLDAPDRTHSTVQSSRGWEATVWHSDALGRAVLVTRDFPAAPHGLVYQLWLVQPRSGPVSAGLMLPGADQTTVLEGDAATANGAAVTLEPDGGSTHPTSRPVATFDFGQAA